MKNYHIEKRGNKQNSENLKEVFRWFMQTIMCIVITVTTLGI